MGEQRGQLLISRPPPPPPPPPRPPNGQLPSSHLRLIIRKHLISSSENSVPGHLNLKLFWWRLSPDRKNFWEQQNEEVAHFYRSTFSNGNSCFVNFVTSFRPLSAQFQTLSLSFSLYIGVHKIHGLELKLHRLSHLH